MSKKIIKASLTDINKWLAGEKVGNSTFKLNAGAKIISAENEGNIGSVIP